MAGGLGAGLALALANRAEAQPKKAPEAKKPEPKKPDAKKGAAVLASLATCLAKATNCDAHCAMQLANGDKSFVRCAAAVRDMLAVGQATTSLVSRASVNAKKMVELCAAACRECSAACLEHKAHFSHGMHIECKECMEACDACVKACDAYLAA
jgi:Cys-rich four helix bundle protein (predicted Tat secretion target)